MPPVASPGRHRACLSRGVASAHTHTHRWLASEASPARAHTPLAPTSEMATVLFKRGPAAQNDADDDDAGDQILRPAFAVSGEPTNEHAPPCDGFEYLRRVRKES